MNGYVGLSLLKNRRLGIAELKEHAMISKTVNVGLVVGLAALIAKITPKRLCGALGAES
jgi:hypothetical protein